MKTACESIMTIVLVSLLVSLSLVPVAGSEEAPQVEWSEIFGGDEVDRVHSVEQTIDCGYIFVGGTMSYGSGYMDVWLVKTDSVGNQVWNKTFGTSVVLWGQEYPAYDEGFSVQQTTGGGYIVVGYCKAKGFGYKSNKLWLIKTDVDGELEWNKTLGESVYYEGSYRRPLWSEGFSVKQTIDGGYIIAGDVQPRGDRSGAIWLIKTDAYGDRVWEQVFHGGGAPPYEVAYASSVQQTTDGGYSVVGSKGNRSTATHDVWLIKTDSTGTVQWNKTYGKEYVDPYSGDKYSGDERASSSQQTIDGGYIITGASYSRYDVRGWVIKTDALGEKIWEITMEPYDWACAAQQTIDGGYIIFGSSTDAHARKCIRLTKTDGEGTELWEKLTDGWWVCHAQDGLQTDDGGYIVVADIKRAYGVSGDVWLVKLGHVPTPPIAEVYFNLNPNPVGIGETLTLRGILVDEFSQPLSNETVEVYARPLAGPWRYTTSLTTNTYGTFTWQATIPEHATGTFIFAVYYPGSETHDSCYNLAILIVQ